MQGDPAILVSNKNVYLIPLKFIISCMFQMQSSGGINSRKSCFTFLLWHGRSITRLGIHTRKRKRTEASDSKPSLIQVCKKNIWLSKCMYNVYKVVLFWWFCLQNYKYFWVQAVPRYLLRSMQGDPATLVSHKNVYLIPLKFIISCIF